MPGSSLNTTPTTYRQYLSIVLPAGLYDSLTRADSAKPAPMRLLDQLWDDTVAGPPPESGLGRLRKFKTSSSRSSSGKGMGCAESEGGGSIKTYGDQDATPSEEAIRVTRSIMIVKPPGYQSGSPPVSPAGSTPPVSPFSGGGRGHSLLRRKSMSDAYEKPSRSPPSPYDV